MAPDRRFRTGACGVIQGTFLGGSPRIGAAPHVANAVQAAHRAAPAPPPRPGPAARILPAPAAGTRPPVQPRTASPAVVPGRAVDVGHILDLGRRGPGQPLPSDLRQTMEAVLQADLSDVRIHQGPEAPAIGALAFAHGSDLYFAPGRYNPGSPHGRRLIAHELTHVVQQRAGRVRNPLGGGLVVVQDAALEAEAERIANGVGRSGSPVQLARNPAVRGVVQRASYQSTRTDSVFRVRHLQTSKGPKIEVEDENGNYAYLIYKYFDDTANAVTVLTVYGEDMRVSGTRVSYLLLRICAEKAKRDGKTEMGLGTAVYMKQDASQQDAGSRAAAHVYGELGFDVSSAEAASSSSVSVDQVISRAGAKIHGLWVQVEDAPVSVHTPLLNANSGDGGSCCRCFLVTACARVRGLPADCEELAELRAFRDRYMGETEERRALVELYSRIAPGIVAAIDACDHAEEEYAAIYAAIAECRELIGQGRDAEVFHRYRALVEDLAARYAPWTEEPVERKRAANQEEPVVDF